MWKCHATKRTATHRTSALPHQTREPIIFPGPWYSRAQAQDAMVEYRSNGQTPGTKILVRELVLPTRPKDLGIRLSCGEALGLSMAHCSTPTSEHLTASDSQGTLDLQVSMDSLPHSVSIPAFLPTPHRPT